ncbi:MAG: dehydrogenase [Pseudomonadota bacterium]|jgi:glutathione-regulated potassium-efflux system ancillary protein KefF
MPQLPQSAPLEVAPAPRVLVLAAHPDLRHSHITRALMGAAAGAGAEVAVRDLYALYPDYLIDVAAEREALIAAELVVWLHPIHWYSMPPLMKLWQDEVLVFGWAYGPGGHALRGKDLWLVASTGGTEDAYRPDGHNRYFFDAFLPPYEQTAALCGLRFLPPLVLHGAHRVSAAELQAHAREFAQRLASHPNWPEMDELPECAACEVPDDERPTEHPSLGEDN